MNTTVQHEAPTTTPAVTEQRNLGRLADTVLGALTVAGLPTEAIGQAREMLIRGMVQGTWAEAVRDMGNDSLISVVDSLEAIVDRVYRHQSLKPLINAARMVDEVLAAEPGHFPWCKPGECVTQYYDDGDTYIEHTGPSITMAVPKDMEVGHNELLRAVLGADEGCSGDPLVSINSGGNGVLLDPGELDDVIEDFADFLYGLRSMRARMTTERADVPV
ncbi:hypothetical protein AB8O64_19885 [Streptomyces sp. QH1-20]|uniref:DUF6907 domain-containing protein n=1 Tax=Streptomyces sp. QH1-20 TaxID=3240934 RepID=UPI0035111799